MVSMKKMSNDVVKAVTGLEDDHLRTLGATILCTWLATIGWHERAKKMSRYKFGRRPSENSTPSSATNLKRNICVHILQYIAGRWRGRVLDVHIYQSSSIIIIRKEVHTNVMSKLVELVLRYNRVKQLVLPFTFAPNIMLIISLPMQS